LNYLKRELKLKTKMRMGIQDAMFAYGVVKVRYAAEIKDNEKAGQPITAEGSENPLVDDTGNPLLEPDELPVGGHYEVTRIHPDDILIDEDAGPLEDSWNWIAHRIRMSLDKARENKRYSKAALKMLAHRGEVKDDEQRAREDRKKGGDIKGKTEGPERGDPKTHEPQTVVFWEIYQPQQKTWITIAEGGEIPVADEAPYPPGIEDHPFAFLRFTLRDDSPYPIPPVSQLMDPAKEYNRARSDIQKHRKRFNRKYAASRQSFGDATEEISKFESGDDGTVVMVNGDTRAAISPIQDAQLDPLRYNELAYLKAEMVELAGHNSSESMGIANASSATQSAVLDKRLEIKEGDAMSMVIDFTLDVARKLDMLAQTHMDSDQAVKVSGPQGEFWEVVKPQYYQQIEGEYEYEVNVGATTPRMPHIERASWQAFLGLLATMPHLATSKRLLTKMAEMHHIEDEAMIEELFQMAQKILSGQSPMPGQAGSQAGVGEDRPMSAMGGQAGGVKSLSQGTAAIAG
jgi:hypothetical protein